MDEKEHMMRHILDIAKSLPYDYTTCVDGWCVRYESDGRTLYAGTETRATMPTDLDVDEVVEEVIGYTWSVYNSNGLVYNSDGEGTDPAMTDGADSEAAVIAAIAGFMDQAD